MTMPVNDLTCRELVEVVTDYLEGALEADDRRRFDEHLANCPGCTAYVDQMRETIRLTGRLRDQDVGAEAVEPLLRAFRRWKDSRSESPNGTFYGNA